MYKKIGIIAAMAQEAEKLLSACKINNSEVISGITFNEVEISGKSAVIAVCGIGKVFAAVCAQTMIIKYGVDAVINTGVAGSLSEELSICDIAIAENVAQHDMDTSPLGDPKCMVSGVNIIYFPADKNLNSLLEKAVKELNINYKFGTIASGDQFIADSDKKKEIVSNLGAISCEMEGASIGHVCYINKVPFAVLRAISDGGNEAAAIDFPTFTRLASENNFKVLNYFFEKI